MKLRPTKRLSTPVASSCTGTTRPHFTALAGTDRQTLRQTFFVGFFTDDEHTARRSGGSCCSRFGLLTDRHEHYCAQRNQVRLTLRPRLEVRLGEWLSMKKVVPSLVHQRTHFLNEMDPQPLFAIDEREAPSIETGMVPGGRAPQWPGSIALPTRGFSVAWPRIPLRPCGSL